MSTKQVDENTDDPDEQETNAQPEQDQEDRAPLFPWRFVTRDPRRKRPIPNRHQEPQ
jgi:hypothetical protein